MPSKIPFVDLRAQYTSIKSRVDRAVANVLERTQFVGGAILSDFEESFGTFCETEHAIGTSSGTASLHLALLAMDIGPGDEVILPSHTFIATVEPVVQVGARPVLADICPDTCTTDSVCGRGDSIRL